VYSGYTVGTWAELILRMKNSADTLIIDAMINDASGKHSATDVFLDANFDYITGNTYVDFLNGNGKVKIHKIVVEDDYEQYENYHLKSNVHNSVSYNSEINQNYC